MGYRVYMNEIHVRGVGVVFLCGILLSTTFTPTDLYGMFQVKAQTIPF